MILETLRIQNFRKYKDVSLEFPRGVIGVVGLNGSGKSTIFEAVSWALFGTVAARTQSEDIRRNSAEPSAVCLVDVCFHFEGDEYRIVRQMKGKSLVTQAKVTKNGTIVASGAGASSAYIQKLLGMDYKSFFTSIFAKQNELNTLSSMNASERRPLILKMLGIDALDDVIKQINADKRTKTSLVNHLEKNLLDKNGSDKHSLLLEREKDLKGEYHKISKEIRDMKKILKQQKIDQKTVQDEMRKAKNAYEDINKEYEESIKKKTLYEKHQKLIQQQTVMQEKIKRRDKTIQTLENDLSDFKDVTAELEKIDEKIDSLQNRSTSLVQKISKQKAVLHHLQSHSKEIGQKKNSIDDLGADASCPTCERELGEQFQFLLEKYDKKQIDLNDKQDACKKEIDDLMDQQSQVKNELTAMQRKKDFFNKKQNDYREIIVKIDGQKQEKNDEEKELKTVSEQIKKTPFIDFDVKTFESIQQERKKHYKDYQMLIRKGNKDKDLISKHTLDIEKKQGHLLVLKQKIDAIKKERDTVREMQKTIESEQKMITDISFLKDVMSSFRLHLVSRIRPALSHYASSFFHDLTDGKYSEMTLDDQYNIYIFDDGEKYPIQRFSGGEIDLANLCLRLAISDVITEQAEGLFHFIVLDEIFGSQDKFRQQNIMQELYKLSSVFKQIFLITHVEDVKHFMQHIIHVEESDGYSMVSVN